MQSDVLWSSVEQLCHLLLAQPNRFFGELHIQTNRVIRALVYNYRFVCLTICLHLFCHLLSFPLIRVGPTIIYCLYFYSFSIHFHDHLATILNVTVWPLSLLYLFPFLLYLFLFHPQKGTTSFTKIPVSLCRSVAFQILLWQNGKVTKFHLLNSVIPIIPWIVFAHFLVPSQHYIKK